MADNIRIQDLDLNTPVPAKKQSSNPTHESQNHQSSTNLDDREANLRAELASVQRINGVIENLLASLRRAKSNMSTVENTVASASALLDTYTRILAQTEHNQRLLLHPEWKGATDDAENAEAEIAARQAERDRREREERARAEERRRAAAVEEERRAAQASAPVTPARRGSVRGRAGAVGAGAMRARGSGIARGAGGVGSGIGSGPELSKNEKATRGRAAIAHYGRVRGGGIARGASRGRGAGG